MSDVKHNISKLIHTALDLLPVVLKMKRHSLASYTTVKSDRKF